MEWLQNKMEQKKHFDHLILIPALLILLAAFGGLIAKTIPRGYLDWLPFFLAGGGSLVIFYFYHKLFHQGYFFKTSHSKILQTFYWSLVLFLLGIIVKSTQNAWHDKLDFPMLALLLACIATSWTVLKKILHYHQIHSNLWLFFTFFFFVESCCSLFQLGNWPTLSAVYHSYQFTIIPLLFLSSMLALIFIFYDDIKLIGQNNFFLQKIHRFANLPHKSLFFTIAFFSISFILSFRYDTLFAGGIEGPSSIWHWRYFVEPVQTLKQGGWLLWDSPSLYGFLNIAIAALLPTNTSWHAIYLLQGIMLFIAASIMYKIMIASNANLFKKGIATLLILSALYFSYNSAGPYLWPSNSALRFIGCYAFLWLLYSYWSNSFFTLKKFVCYGSLLWVLFVLWSAESAIYTSFIFYPTLITVVIQHLSAKKMTVKQAGLYLLAPILLLGLTIIGIDAYYYLFLGHLPDWIMFVEYGFWCAAGFIHQPLDVFGPIWLVFLLFISMLMYLIPLILQSPQDRNVPILVGLTGCLYAITSYFMARAIPGYIAAIFPLLITIIVFSLQIASHHPKLFISHFFIKIAAFPLCFILLVTLSDPTIFKYIEHFKTLSFDITKQLPVANSDFKFFLQHAGINAKDLVTYDSVYYGYDTELMRTSNKNEKSLWLPSPIYTFMEPIPERRKQAVVQRFLNREARSGYVIHDKTSTQEEFSAWQKFMTAFFKPTKVYQNSKWIIVRYEPTINNPQDEGKDKRG